MPHKGEGGRPGHRIAHVRPYGDRSEPQEYAWNRGQPLCGAPLGVFGWGRLRAVILSLTCLTLASCARGESNLRGWRAMQPGMQLRVEERRGPQAQDALGLLYTVVPGREYWIERAMPMPGLQGMPSLRLWARSTRVLYVAVVLVDTEGAKHESALTVAPGEWRELVFDGFSPPVDDWARVAMVRVVDRTGVLLGQGPVSLKLVGLPW